MSPPSIPARARVVVVGGGFAGAATAYHLARAGVPDVLILERESTCGYHASGRNAGLCRQLTDDELVTDLAVRGADFLRNPPAGFSSAPIFRQTGSLLISAHPIRLDQMGSRALLHRLPSERLDRDGLLARWPRLSGLPAAGAVSFPTDGVIDIHALLQGFLAGARAAGAQVELNVEVRKFRHGRDPSSVTVETSRGSVAASCVVNAAGAWAGEIGKRAGSGAGAVHQPAAPPVPDRPRAQPRPAGAVLLVRGSGGDVRAARGQRLPAVRLRRGRDAAGRRARDAGRGGGAGRPPATAHAVARRSDPDEIVGVHADVRARPPPGDRLGPEGRVAVLGRGPGRPRRHHVAGDRPHGGRGRRPPARPAATAAGWPPSRQNAKAAEVVPPPRWRPRSRRFSTRPHAPARRRDDLCRPWRSSRLGAQPRGDRAERERGRPAGYDWRHLADSSLSVLADSAHSAWALVISSRQ